MSKLATSDDELFRDYWVQLRRWDSVGPVVVGGYKVVLVNGDQVKLDHLMDFTEGGNPERYDFVPDDEVWIDSNASDSNRRYIALHELCETFLMKERGLSYEKAHARCNEIEKRVRAVESGRLAMKIAADTELAYKKVPMVGKLTLKQKDGDYGILKVPEAFKKAVYDAIWEEGMQYDDLHEKHEAHISVFDDVEMKELRKKGKIPEDGKDFKFDLKSVEMVEPEGWPEMEKVWFVTVDSPELEALRKKYGFTPLMKGDHKFHITVAVKPRGKKKAFDLSSIVDRIVASHRLV